LEDAHTYFMDVFAEKRANASVLGEGLNTFVPTGEDHENTEDLYSEIWESEVAAKLQSAVNTAPGADHCEYSHLKKIDPAAKILTLIFNRCHRQKDVPQLWKEALTILIYKKGDDRDVSNFRANCSHVSDLQTADGGSCEALNPLVYRSWHII
jgi:hypothetical protein